MPDNNGWNEWSRHVLTELKSLRQDIKDLDTKVDSIVVEVTKLQVKSGMWGAISGAVVASVIGVIIRLALK